MATTDHCFLDLHLSKVNFNCLIKQFEQIFMFSIFWLFLCKTNIKQSYLKIYQQLIDLYPIKHKT